MFSGQWLKAVKVTDDSKCDEMDENATANLHLALVDGVLSSIEEKISAKDIWDHLSRLYEARSLHNKKFIKRKLYALRMTKVNLVTEQVNNMNTLFSQLASLSCKIDSQERAKSLIQSLPDSYDHVIIYLTSDVLPDYLVFDDVAAAILEEENRRNNKEDNQTSSRQVEALVMTRGCQWNLAPVGVTVTINLKQKRRRILNGSRSPCHRAAVTWHQKLIHIEQHHLKFKTSNSRSVFILELVHSVVWQALKKSDVLKVFKVYKARVKLDSEKKIKCLRTDNGSEYTGDVFDTFCKWHSDYVMESNIPYCLLTEEGETSTLQEALNKPDASFWKEAMQEEVESLYMEKYGNLRHYLGMQIYRDRMSPSSEKERMKISRVPYASAVRSLMFTMICTRPDLAHRVGVILLSKDMFIQIMQVIFMEADQPLVMEYVPTSQANKEAVWLEMLLEEHGHKQEKEEEGTVAIQHFIQRQIT
nr:Gag-Pol polyprotein [Tanacetum cinerariifolium]